MFFPVSRHLQSRKAGEQMISIHVVDDAVDKIETMLEDLADELSDVPSPAATPEPDALANGKRRMGELDGHTETNRSARSVSSSFCMASYVQICVCLYSSSPDAKRQRKDANGHHSFSAISTNGLDDSFYGVPPTPSEASTVSPRSASTSINGDRPSVSIAQLRALTQSVKRKYGVA